jgi:hypothetical protein
VSARTILKHVYENGGMTKYQFDRIDRVLKERERPHGEWIEKPWGVVCSRCKAQALHTPNGNQSRSDYCPDCGADMREGESN